MITARIGKRFGARPDSSPFELNVEFTAASGATALFGPSGAGKTLTLEAIAGFVQPDTGRILLGDRILFDAEARVSLPPRARRCGYVIQQPALFPHMTLRENLAFAAEQLPRSQRAHRVSEMLDAFRLGDVSGRRPHELSGGQKQRCSIARALVGRPEVLLLDEPARGLDAPLRAELYDVLRQVRYEFGTPLLVVTHDLDEVFELADEMIVLREGRIVQTGTPSEVSARPASLDVARLLGIFNIFTAEVLALDPSRNSSRLRYAGGEFTGQYLPGHLIGDRTTVCVPVASTRATPAEGGLPLERCFEKAHTVRLEFDGAISAETPRGTIDAARPPRTWRLDFDPAAVRVLKS